MRSCHCCRSVVRCELRSDLQNGHDALIHSWVRWRGRFCEACYLRCEDSDLGWDRIAHLMLHALLPFIDAICIGFCGCQRKEVLYKVILLRISWVMTFAARCWLLCYIASDLEESALQEITLICGLFLTIFFSLDWTELWNNISGSFISFSDPQKMHIDWWWLELFCIKCRLIGAIIFSRKLFLIT